MPRVRISWKLLTAHLEELEEVGGEMEAGASLHGWMDGWSTFPNPLLQ